MVQTPKLPVQPGQGIRNVVVMATLASADTV